VQLGFLAEPLQRRAGPPRAIAELEGDAWITLATRFAGGFTELLAPGRVLTAASPDGQLAYESRTLAHSYLVAALADAFAPTRT
jgi:hypothetical protein